MHHFRSVFRGAALRNGCACAGWTLQRLLLDIVSRLGYKRAPSGRLIIVSHVFGCLLALVAALILCSKQ